MSRRNKAKGDGLYKDPRTPYWQIDKEFAGHRLRGSSRTTSYGEAKAQVETWIAGVRRDLLLESIGEKPRPGAKLEITIDAAATRYYEEVGAKAKTADNIDMNLAWICEHINKTGDGKNTKLSTITEAMLIELAAIRRGHGLKGQRKAWAPISEASINRYVIDLVRRLMRRAAITWKANVAAIDWTVLRTPEPRGGSFQNELPLAAEREMYGELRVDIHDYAHFLTHTGHRSGRTRQMEWAHVDFDAGVYRLRKKTRTPGEHFQEFPMTETARTLLLAQRGRHPKFVWTYVIHQRRGRWKVGDRRPLTITVTRRHLKKALSAVGQGHLRVHDLRHTTARRALRKTKNLRAVQRVLGHADISTTAIYADVMHDDVRAALEETETAYNPRNIPGVESAEVEQMPEVLGKKKA